MIAYGIGNLDNLIVAFAKERQRLLHTEISNILVDRLADYLTKPGTQGAPAQPDFSREFLERGWVGEVLREEELGLQDASRHMSGRINRARALGLVEGIKGLTDDLQRLRLQEQPA